jgi:hypothetical protein
MRADRSRSVYNITSVPPLDGFINDSRYFKIKFTHVADFWLDNIITGFIIEFAVDTAKSYTIA